MQVEKRQVYVNPKILHWFITTLLINTVSQFATVYCVVMHTHGNFILVKYYDEGLSNHSTFLINQLVNLLVKQLEPEGVTI